MPGLQPRVFADNLPIKNQCQAPVKEVGGDVHRCPNTAKLGKRYCGRHKYFGLPREAWDRQRGRKR